MDSVQIGGIYRHYKDKLYRVLNVARHSETREELVIYETLYDSPGGKIWARPKSMFLEEIVTESFRGPRFCLIDSSDQKLQSSGHGS